MKFRKTAVALAVAGVCVAPMAAQADTTLSGVIEIQLEGTDEDVDDDLTTPDVDESLAGDAQIAAGDVRVQILADQELNTSGLTGYGSVQFNFDNLSNGTGDDDSNEGTIEADEIYVGVMGDFGDLRIGEIPLALDFAELANDIYEVTPETPGGLSYTGDFGPVALGLSFSPEPNDDMVGLGLGFNLAGFTIGLGVEDRSDDTLGAIGAAYTIAGFSLAAHYWSLAVDAEDIFDNDPDGDPDTDDGVLIDLPEADATGLAVQGAYGIGDVTLALTYATYTLDEDDDPQQQALRLDAGYDLGGGLILSTRLTQYDSDDGFTGGLDPVGANDTAVGGEDLLEWRIQVDKVF